MSSTNSSKSPLDAAQKIVAELTGMTDDHQMMAIRFACETLGLNFPMPQQNQEVLPARAPPTTPSLVRGEDHSTDIRSFTAMKAPKSDQQFCAVVAYFYQFEAKPSDRKEAIDAETMKEAARLAGRPQVARWNMTLTNAKNAGYLDSVGTGKFRLSSVGENLVAITLPDGAAPPNAKKNHKWSKPKQKQKSINKKR